MYKRLKSAKPTYSYDRLQKDFQQVKYIESLIKFKRSNPNMLFETPEKYQKKLVMRIGEGKDKMTNSGSSFKEKENPLSQTSRGPFNKTYQFNLNNKYNQTIRERSLTTKRPLTSFERYI